MNKSGTDIRAPISARRFSAFSRSSNYSDKNATLFSKKDVIILNTNHVPQLEEMVTQDTTNMFGQVDIYEVMYTAFISLGVLSPEGDLAGAVVLQNYPHIKSVPSWCWLPWMRQIFGCDSVTQMNSIWIHLLVWKERYINIFLRPMLQYFFEKVKYKQYVMVAIPPGVEAITCLGKDSSRIMPRGYVNALKMTTLGLMARRSYVPYYKIRKAVEEDNDDILPLIAKYTTLLQETYGNYYIAELLTRFPESKRQIIVAEFKGFAVAVVILNEVVNYDILEENFELVCFHGLRKPHKNDFIEKVQTEEVEEEESFDYKLETLPESMQLALKKAPSQRTDEDNTSVDDEWDIDKSIANLFGLAKEEMRPHLSKLTFSSHILNAVLDSRDQQHGSRASWMLKYNDYESHLFKEASLKRSNLMESVLTLPNVQSTRKRPLRTFYGAKDAFVLEVAAAKEDHDEALELLVEAAFESFPDRDYCCMTIPTVQPPIGFTDRFVKVPPQDDSNFPHDLFVLHRNTVDPEIIVRIASDGDEPYIEEFFNQLQEHGNVREQVKFAMDKDPALENSSDICILMIAYNQIVGLAVLSENIELEYILSHYEVYKWVNASRQEAGSYAIIENLLIYPIFQNFANYFVTQMHTQADYSVIFYIVTPEDIFSKKNRLICNAIQHLIPSAPRIVQDYSPKYLKKKETSYSVFLSMIGMSSITRIEINTRILVVGFGYTAASFLQTLVTTSSPDLYITFSGVVVVSPHDRSHRGVPNRTRDLFFVHRHNHNRRCSHLATLRTHVNFTPGIVTEIRRQDKYVFLSDGTCLPYDILVIMAGEQHQLPNKIRTTLHSEIPPNVFIINTDTDAAVAMKTLNEIMVKDINPDGKVIVYGRELRSHATLAALKEFGVPSELLVFVNPASEAYNINNYISHEKMVFDDPDVEIAMLRILQEQGVTHYQGNIVDWVRSTQSNLISKVKFECYKRLLTLDCKCIFIYSNKSISKRTFQAIINAGLVFDGKLVIDSNFCTNDPNIYAAGPLTKYSRKYHADHMTHLYYNTEEIGEKLALHIRNMLIPENYRPKQMQKPLGFLDKIEQKQSILPVFTKPLVKLCRLVGNLNYCHITKPGMRIPAELEVTRSNFGQLYVTGDLESLDKQGYFRIHINEFKEVETITCLTRDEIYLQNLLQIWGKHVKMLNNFQLRFELMMIPDLFEYFKEPWTCGIYYDRFTEVREKVKRNLVDIPLANGKSLAENTYDVLVENNWKDLTKQQKVDILQLFNESNLRNRMEQLIVDYVEENANHLPMYAHPILLRSILHDYEKSPMFSD
ncbi:hypothetical protein WA026_016737 [Henosepilachna vigintioctopunctata]|uniref:Cilia- and flagella-associated protein 61 N-terminal domain-containing protein n=1 Tax=Henosepilachna vigintioctopunctata TaxID=420089 RepID=A0AAW1V3K5_9CUCU